MAKVVVGQEELVFGLLVTAIAGGHVLIEGAPGLGKTLVARSFARVSGTTFKRIQFTPDLMPSDVTGSTIFERQTGTFNFIPGPIFCQLMLADEINRAPAKTQSALLEAMQDHQVTVDGTSRPLPAPFIVVATQNPVESQGTYPLPEAQLDRFLMKVTVGDPPREVEQKIVMNHATGFDPTDLSALGAVTTPEEIVAMQAHANRVRVDDAIIAYIVDLARRTQPHAADVRGDRAQVGRVVSDCQRYRLIDREDRTSRLALGHRGRRSGREQDCAEYVSHEVSSPIRMNESCHSYGGSDEWVSVGCTTS
jgi:MoxR-like ATPase